VTELKTIGMLQGPAGPFMGRLAMALNARGARVARVHLSAGDWLDWPSGLGQAESYRGTFEKWPEWFANWLDRHEVRTLVLLGEQRPVHRVILPVVEARGIQVMALELGYLRPDWLTLEPNGMSGRSLMPRNPDTVREMASYLLPPDTSAHFKPSFAEEAWYDVRYHVANTLLGWLWPHYRSHLPLPGWLIDAGIGLHMARTRWTRRRAKAAIDRMVAYTTPWFLLALQIDNDFQVRAYSPYSEGGIDRMVQEVLESFAHHAPAHVRLVVKTHPREVIWSRHMARGKALAKALGIESRVEWLDGGTIVPLLKAKPAVININSTTGLEALRYGCPVKVLGQAVYDVPGLTDAQPLDTFWQQPKAPDRALVDDFCAVLAAHAQVKGTFYGEPGVQAAVSAMAERLMDTP
jgi:capsular polysaccharide export protein